MAITVYQLKVSLVGLRPPVWRRLLVPADLPLRALHEVIQVAFGWWDQHLHEFEIGGARFGTDDGEGWGPPPRDETATILEAVVDVGDTFAYVYDFGDDWRHEVTVEAVLAATARDRYPACVDGRRACPPEDCGGVWGYTDFLHAIADPDDDDHEQMLQWIGGKFDPEAFDPAEVDYRLRRPHPVAL